LSFSTHCLATITILHTNPKLNSRSLEARSVALSASLVPVVVRAFTVLEINIAASLEAFLGFLRATEREGQSEGVESLALILTVVEVLELVVVVVIVVVVVVVVVLGVVAVVPRSVAEGAVVVVVAVVILVVIVVVLATSVLSVHFTVHHERSHAARVTALVVVSGHASELALVLGHDLVAVAVSFIIMGLIIDTESATSDIDEAVAVLADDERHDQSVGEDVATIAASGRAQNGRHEALTISLNLNLAVVVTEGLANEALLS